MSRLIREQDVIKAVDEHTNDNGLLDTDISIILEDIPTVIDLDYVINYLKYFDPCAYPCRKDADDCIECVKNSFIEFLQTGEIKIEQ